MWEWTACKLAVILRTGPYRIPPEWTITPTCDIWHPVGRKATLWLLAQLVTFQTMIPGRPTLSEYITYMKQNKTRLYKNRERKVTVANYLCVVDEWEEVCERVSEYEKQGLHNKGVVNHSCPVTVPKRCKQQISRGALLLTIVWHVVLYIVQFSCSCNGTLQMSVTELYRMRAGICIISNGQNEIVNTLVTWMVIITNKKGKNSRWCH
jgi:hypothetical protein